MPPVQGNQQTLDPALAGQAGSPYQAVLQKLNADPENSKETISAIDEMIRSHAQVQAQDVVTSLRNERTVERALDLMHNELDRVIGADEEFEKFRKPLELLVKNEFNTAEGGEENVKKLLAGGMDKEAIKALVSKHAKTLLGENKQSKGGLSGMQTEGNSQSAAAQAATDKQVSSRKELNDPQKAVYDAKMAEWQTIGPKDRKRLGLPDTEDEMNEKALKVAASKFKEGLKE